MNYSILMAVYYKDNPVYFEESILSMLNQTVRSNDFVIVCDGPLSDSLNDVLEKFKEEKTLHIIRKEKNEGLGKALNYALPFCKNELIARMDSDDVALPNRAHKQLEAFINNPKLGMVSSFVDEYDLELKNKLNVRKIPQLHDEIIKYARKRNPFNHPSMMFKKSDVLKADGYLDLYLHEDYYLWIRMLINGTVAYNIQESLLMMRAGDDMIKRRGGYKYAKAGLKLQKYMKDHKFISKRQYYKNVVTRFTVQALMPNWLRNIFYKIILRK